DVVPFARTIRCGRHILNDLPVEDGRAIEAGQTQLAAARVKSVVAILRVAAEDEPRGTGFIVELDRDREFERKFRRFALRQAERAAAEPGAGAVGEDATRALPPASAIHRLPFAF